MTHDVHLGFRAMEKTRPRKQSGVVSLALLSGFRAISLVYGAGRTAFSLVESVRRLAPVFAVVRVCG